MKSLQRGLVAVLVVLAYLVPASGQSSQGRILGRVTDSSGAVVPKATVTVANTETGIERKLQANEAGEYSAPNLPAGVYSVSANAPTFKTTRRANIRLEVATELQIDLTLQPGDVAQVEEVSGDAPLVDTISDVLGGTMDNKLINELPLLGRDFQNLLELRPGVQRTPGGGFHSVTSNGNRFEDNNYIVDGTDDNDVYYGETVINGVGVSGTPASHLPLDAIQEFNTQENQGSDYGWKPGAVVNIGLKSGTNDLHGTAYYFHRNSAFDARNFFNPNPQPISDLILHDFGTSLGGPIIKNKWFFFGNYEGVRHKVGNPFNVFSPITDSVGDPEVSLPDAKADAGCPAACSDVSLVLADLFLNNPGGTAPNGDPTAINFNFDNKNREDNFIIKTDYKLNDRNLITGRYFYANSVQTEEDTSALRPEWLTIASTKVNVMGVNWTWTGGRWVNEARFGYNRNWQIDDVADHDKSAAAYGLKTGVTNPLLFGFPQIFVEPFDAMGGNRNWPLDTIPNHTYQLIDNVAVTKGSHNLRFGGEFRHGGSDNFRARNGRGRIFFDSLEDFLQGNVDFAQILIGDTHRNVTLSSFGAFVQDDWRIRRNVTVNLGMRYDLSLPIKDKNDLLSNFIPSRDGLIQVGHGIDSLYDTDWNNFSPRLGVAWDVFGTGKTVLRAGGAVIFEQPTIRQFIDRGGFNENPSGVDGVTPGTGTINVASREIDDSDALSAAWLAGTPLFNTEPNALFCDITSPCDVRGLPPHLSTPYTEQWNVNIQQALGPKTVLQVAYVGNHGVKLYSLRDINQANSQVSAQCFWIDGGDQDECRQNARPFVTNCSGSGPCMPWVGYANELENLGNSIYHSLQVTLTQRSYKGLDLLVGYTYAHAIDNATSNRSGFPANNNDYAKERGNGDYDIRHRFTLSLNYDVPQFKAPLQMGKGWQVTSVLNLQTGEPYTFFDSFDDFSATFEELDRWDFAGNPSDVHWSKGPQQAMTYLLGSDATSNPLCAANNRNPDLDLWGCFVSGSAVLTPPNYGTFGNMGRNIFRGPGFANLDMSVSKRWNLSDRLQLQLRGEFFNVLNHPNFNVFNMDTDLSDPVFGINSLGIVADTPDVGVANPVMGSGGSRHIQLGVKFIW